jgi:serine/threonine-protein kinase
VACPALELACGVTVDDEVKRASTAPWSAGDLIAGQFVIRRLLGAGGMSSVWDAYDQILCRPVALKITHTRALSAPLLTHEARALSAIKHSGLPVPYHVGLHHGWTFLAIERLFGVTLSQRLHEDPTAPPLTVAETVRILAGVAEVLIAVHAAGMSHHDVKPDNVMLGADGRVVLLDFGIMVPEIDTTHAGDSGTPTYLAPEVMIGALRRGEAHRLDIYAFGVMAFEMLAGRPPFYSTDLATLMRMHVCEAPPDLCTLRSDCPPALAALIDSCLAKCPSSRPDSIELVHWELLALQRSAAEQRRGSSNHATPRRSPSAYPVARSAG